MRKSGYRRVSLMAIGLSVFLIPAGVAAAACPVARPPCAREAFTGSVGPHHSGCVGRPASCVVQAGAPGPKGPRGIRGLRGVPGLRGVQGFTGAAGPPGAKGSAGAIGATGIQGLQGVQGAIGLAGQIGAPGVPGTPGTPGLPGAQGIPGTAGTAGTAGTPGTPGLPGAQGIPGTPGTPGPPGVQGTPGTPGAATGLPQYAYIYNTTAQTVAVGADAIFDANGVLTSGITHTLGTSQVVIHNSGNYEVTFSVSATEANQMALSDNGTAVLGTIYGSGAGTQQNTGQAIVALDAGDLLTLTNHTSASTITLPSLVGGSQAEVNASLTILQLG
jgi:hypothetical protein